MRRLLIAALVLLSSGCQYYGASILNLSHLTSPEKYSGPVYAVPGDAPIDGWQSLQANYESSDGIVVLSDFEHNAYLADGVWDLADYVYYRNMVKYAPTGGQCMVVMLGWRADGSLPELVHARDDIIDIMATRRSAKVIVDWRPVAEAHPEYYGSSDPIHPNTEAGLDAFADLIQSGIDSCPS
jgi:hypothetical protein